VPKLALGQIIAGSEVEEKLQLQDILTALSRHLVGDWGELETDSQEANQWALISDEPVLSFHRSHDGVKFYILTDAKREKTTILLA